jgi:hypothetical protein
VVRTNEPASARGIRIRAGGRIAESFYIDLSLLAKVNGAVKNGTAVDLSAWRPQDAKNSFAGTTVESIVWPCLLVAVSGCAGSFWGYTYRPGRANAADFSGR